MHLRIAQVSAFSLLLPMMLLTSCGAVAPRVSPGMVAIAQRADPAADEVSLTRGRELFTTRCDTCHALPAPASQDEAHWPGFVSTMGRKAKLGREQQDDLLRYVLAARQEP